MIKATIQNSPYCTEIRFPCSETELSKRLGELGMNTEHLATIGTVIEIEPAELSVLEDCDVNLDALNYLGKRMDGMCKAERKLNIQEGKTMGNMRTMAFQVPEELFQKIKDYLQRNNMTQNQFVIGLIENEIERDLCQRADMGEAPTPSEEAAEHTEQRESAAVSDCESVSDEVGEHRRTGKPRFFG